MRDEHNDVERRDRSGRPPVPVTRLLLIIATIAIFVVTQQPLLALVAVLLGAQLFDPVVDWVAHHSDPWLKGRLGGLLPSRWRRGAPRLRSAARLLSWATGAALVVLVALNYTPMPAMAGRLRDAACTRLTTTPDALCPSGVGTTALSLGGGTVRIGLIDSAADGPFDVSHQNAEERKVEAVIFRNDRRSCAGSVPHVTLAVATALSRTVDDISLSADEVGIEDLRGTALAQASYNAEAAHRTKLCLVIANLGNLDSIETTSAVAQVVQRIVLYAKHDPTFIGVVGFPFSSSARQALDALADLGHGEVPIVSPSVTSDQLNTRPNFWRIASTDEVQATALVDFLEWRLAPAPPTRPLNVAVLIDDTDSYSYSLGNDFLADANHTPGQWLLAFEEHYRVEDATSIAGAVVDASRRGADYVMLAGYAYDLGSVEVALQSQHVSAVILGGDGLYDLERYNDHPYAPVFATGYVPPLGAGLMETGEPCPGQFADVYAADFGAPVTSTTPQPSVTFLGAHAILSYDAVCMYGQALSDVEQASRPVSEENLTKALQQASFDGLSGHTTFRDQSRPSVPDSKPVYVMCTDRAPTLRLAATIDVALTGRPVTPSSGASPQSSCPAGGA